MSNYKYKLVVMVDDDDVDCFVTKKIIEDSNFSEKIVVFNSGKEGLEYLRKNENNPEQLPEVIFLDILMPVMDGFGFLDEYDKLSDKIKSKCKIVLLSTSESFKDLN